MTILTNPVIGFSFIPNINYELWIWIHLKSSVEKRLKWRFWQISFVPVMGFSFIPNICKIDNKVAEEERKRRPKNWPNFFFPVERGFEPWPLTWMLFLLLYLHSLYSMLIYWQIKIRATSKPHQLNHSDKLWQLGRGMLCEILRVLGTACIVVSFSDCDDVHSLDHSSTVKRSFSLTHLSWNVFPMSLRWRSLCCCFVMVLAMIQWGFLVHYLLGRCFYIMSGGCAVITVAH